MSQYLEPLVFPLHPREVDRLDLDNPDQVLWRDWPLREGLSRMRYVSLPYRRRPPRMRHSQAACLI